MKSKNFIPSHKRTNDKKSIDYWGMLFIGFIFLSSMSCFLFANHSDRHAANRLSDSAHKISNTIIDTDQSNKS
jgi:hypothetical protein